MKNFLVEHPFAALLMTIVVCDAAITITKLITGNVDKRIVTFKVNGDTATKKEESKEG